MILIKYGILLKKMRTTDKQKITRFELHKDYQPFNSKKIPNKNKVYSEFKKLYSEAEQFLCPLFGKNLSLSFHYKKFINPRFRE